MKLLVYSTIFEGNSADTKPMSPHLFKLEVP